MKGFFRLILMLITVTAGLFAIVAVGFGTFGGVLALTSNSGFVGEGDFYASALIFFSLISIGAGAAAGIVSYACWTWWRHCQT